MKLLFSALALSLLSGPVLAGSSDFITPQAGNAVSQSIVVQAEFIWPFNINIRQVEVPADYSIRNLLASEAAGQALTSQGADTTTTASGQ